MRSSDPSSEGSSEGEPGGGEETGWQRTEPGRPREEVREQSFSSN